jgi:1-phosphofructokinase family hexose kinase
MLIAGPNPTIDRVIGLERFEAGHVNRAEHAEARLGGGGVNAARTARLLGGIGTTLVTVAPQDDRDRFVEQLRAEGIGAELVGCGGQLRVATILREAGGRLSMLTEPGSLLEVREWEAFTRLVRGQLGGGRLLLCTGSLPPGAPIDGYARLAREARHAGSRCIVDAAGDTLAATLEAGEGLVVPNLAEAEGLLLGSRSEPLDPVDAPQRALAAADGLLRVGAHAAVVTAGGAGVAYAQRGRRGGCRWADAPAVIVASPVGAGDAFSAGLGLGLQRGDSLAEAVGFAVAVAAAHVEGADDLRERVEGLRGSARASA